MCADEGYDIVLALTGRIGIYELLTMTEETREMVMARENAGRIANAAKTSGDLTTLHDAGTQKVREGITTIAEAMRVTKA